MGAPSAALLSFTANMLSWWEPARHPQHTAASHLHKSYCSVGARKWMDLFSIQRPCSQELPKFLRQNHHSQTLPCVLSWPCLARGPSVFWNHPLPCGSWGKERGGIWNLILPLTRRRVISIHLHKTLHFLFKPQPLFSFRTPPLPHLLCMWSRPSKPEPISIPEFPWQCTLVQGGSWPKTVGLNK